jgi:hypothetical protein
MAGRQLHKLSARKVETIAEPERTPADGMQRTYAEVVPTALKRHFDLEVANVTRRAAQYAFENCGAKPGDELTQEQTTKLGPLAAEYMMPFIQRHARRQ